jgi:phage shock protein PspC (stress-responsive transcriptional regulator)
MPHTLGKKDNMRDLPHEPYEGEGEQAPPDEHTRLLPNRVDSSRPVMLSPDDPAVSPYNLWTVRLLRLLTIFFTFVTMVWWAILLVSAFATPPGFHMRGSGFFAFSYASLALATMLFTLMFFGVPSRAVRILAAVMAVSCGTSPLVTQPADKL